LIALIGLLCHNRALPAARLIKGCRGGGDVLTHNTAHYEHFRRTERSRFPP
jgi:hypothetical protein